MEFLLFVVVVLALIAALVLLVMQYRVEVKPATALAYNNMWTGTPDCVLPGTDFLIPGIHRILEQEVSLRNEPENPSNVTLITGDGVELEVDYIVRRLRVGYPEMPEPGDPRVDRARLQQCVIRAVTAISYGKRRDAILTRVVALLQEEMEGRTINDLFPGTDMVTGTIGQIDEDLMSQIEQAVNDSLLTDLVTTEWGFWVEIDLEDYDLPAVIRKAREEQSAAEIAGKAIADKAKAAGVDPRWIVAGDAVAGIFKK